MKIHLERRGGVLMPLSDEDREYVRRIPPGDLVIAEHRPGRNPALFRKFHALVNLIAVTFDMTPDNVRTDLKLRAGHYREHVTQWGEIVYVPRSIAYSECDPAEFAAFYKKAVEAAGREPYSIDVEAEGFA